MSHGLVLEHLARRLAELERDHNDYLAQADAYQKRFYDLKREREANETGIAALKAAIACLEASS